MQQSRSSTGRLRPVWRRKAGEAKVAGAAGMLPVMPLSAATPCCFCALGPRPVLLIVCSTGKLHASLPTATTYVCDKLMCLARADILHPK